PFLLLRFFSSRTRPPPSSPLFPYTTLFRSRLRLRSLLAGAGEDEREQHGPGEGQPRRRPRVLNHVSLPPSSSPPRRPLGLIVEGDRKSTRLNSSHQIISYAVFCLKKKTPNT